MSKTNYTDEEIESLIKNHPLLAKNGTGRYDLYKCKDPFPKVGEALLNSVDLLMYLLTVGIVEPFDVNKLKGVTYQCTFSGEAHRFDPEIGGMKEIHLDDEKELVLQKNSITYLKIAEKFHVPEYMVLRFNLSVSNAYKGLLLGTGPIVDPGFQGNLFIPLHNLTGNDYIIKKGAPLIRVEFTKLSRHVDWGNKREDLFPLINPITKKTPQDAIFSNFIEDALLDFNKKQFYTRDGGSSVRSSIPDMINDSANKAKKAEKSAKAAKYWTIAGALGVLAALAAIVISMITLIHDVNVRYDGFVQEINDCQTQISDLNRQLTKAKEKLEQYEITQFQTYEQQVESEASEEVVSLPNSPTERVDGNSNGS